MNDLFFSFQYNNKKVGAKGYQGDKLTYYCYNKIKNKIEN